MKYVITGGAGNISKPIVMALLDAGHDVRVIGRDEHHLQELISAGATPAIGSVSDSEFVRKAFAGADAVYTMVPPYFDATNWMGFIDQVSEIYTTAIREHNIRYVVNLSSVGGHLPTGAGPVSGLHHVEQKLNRLQEVNVKHLRPGYFYHNFYGMFDMIKNMNILGSNYGGKGSKIIMVHPTDIAKVAADELLSLQFTGSTVRYIAGDELSGDEIAKALGAAIGKPNLPWIEFSNEQALEGMLQAGLFREQAEKYVEMGQCLQNGTMSEDFYKNNPGFSGIKFEDFANEFAQAYGR